MAARRSDPIRYFFWVLYLVLFMGFWGLEEQESSSPGLDAKGSKTKSSPFDSSLVPTWPKYPPQPLVMGKSSKLYLIYNSKIESIGLVRCPNSFKTVLTNKKVFKKKSVRQFLHSLILWVAKLFNRLNPQFCSSWKLYIWRS